MTWEEISKELFEKRTAKRFKLRLSKLGNGMITDTQKREDLYFDKEFLDATLPKANEWLNELADENEQLKQSNTYLQGQLEDYSNVEIDNVELREENEQLKNKIDVLEDDNETYHKSLEKLNLYTKRFIPTKCTNEFKDCKTNRYYWLDHEGNFEGCLELLNLLDCENEILKSENRQLKGRLMLYEEQMKGDFE